jgi:antitoxin component YwqK of YwqJK toxin-antitoxin module
MAVFILVVISCNYRSHKPPMHAVLNSTDSSLHTENGILFYKTLLYNGTTYTLYPNGDTAEITGFNKGSENGYRKRYYPGRKLKEIREFDNGSKVGDYLAWWQNGKRKLNYHFKDNEYEGTCREWNADGVLIIEMNYKNGYEAGPQKMFYDNGKVRSNYLIINGRRYGLLGTKNCVNVSDSIFKN